MLDVKSMPAAENSEIKYSTDFRFSGVFSNIHNVSSLIISSKRWPQFGRAIPNAANPLQSSREFSGRFAGVG